MDTVTLRRLKTDWQSTEPNPDEQFLKSQMLANIEGLEQSVIRTEEVARQKKEDMMPLIKGINMNPAEVEILLKRDAEASMRALREAEQRLKKAPVDFSILEKQDLELARKNVAQQGRAVTASATAWNAAYSGWWSLYNGESEEKPTVAFNLPANRFDPAAQAFGEGWYDSDYSEIHAYLAFRYTPPAWGHLHVFTAPWLHGYYSLYANDAWYKSEYARAELDTWVDVHQNFWRPRQYTRRFTLSGDELHPERSNRIDAQYSHAYYTNVGAGDPVTIRVGVRLYCRGKASGGRASLNFQAGAANYVYVPYVYLYLHQ